jgi:hypothetical protein
VKECLVAIAAILCQNSSNDVLTTTSLSSRAETNFTGELAADVVQNVRHNASKFEVLSLGIDQCTVGSDTAQLMLVRGLDAEVNVTEEVFGRPIHPMK